MLILPGVTCTSTRFFLNQKDTKMSEDNYYAMNGVASENLFYVNVKWQLYDFLELRQIR